MRVLVIGGTGLISTPIVERLRAVGHEPVVFNRGETPSNHVEVTCIKGDRDDFATFAQAMENEHFDAVIDMLTYDADRAAHNVEVFTGRVAHYIFCSTVCVYGGPLSQIPAAESEPHTPVSPYGRGKAEAEAVFMDAFAQKGFPVTMMRPSHCYGPGKPLLDIWGYDGALVSRLRAGLPIVVAGDGHGLWQPGHVDDMAKGFVGALGRERTKGKAYNIVGDEVMTWHNFHRRMGEAIGVEAKVVPLTTAQILAGAPAGKAEWLRENFQYHAAYDGSALKADVPEYDNLISWEDGVRDTVAWMDRTNAHEAPDALPWVDRLVEADREFRAAMEAVRDEGAGAS